MPKRPTFQLQQTSRAKRQKPGNAVTKSSVDSVAEVIRLEKLVEDALSNNSSLNPLADLLRIASETNGEDEVVLKAIFALYRLFVQIARKSLLAITEKRDDETEEGREQRSVIRAWIAGKLDRFTELLCGMLKDRDKGTRASSLKILFSLLRENSAAQKAFDVKYFKKIVLALLTCPSSHRSNDQEQSTTIDSDVRDQFCDSWLNTYVDVRWYFLRETALILNARDVLDEHPFVIANAITILEKLRTIPQFGSKSVLENQDGGGFLMECLAIVPKRKKDNENEDSDEDDPKATEDDAAEDDWRKFFDEDTKPSTTTGPARRRRRIHTMNIHEQLHSVQAHRAVFTKCWLTLLPLLSTSQSKTQGEPADPRDALITRVLEIIHHSVLPHLTRTILVMDWIAGCVDYGGIVGLLALNALFVLITEYNLDYPRFYTKLYSFLDRDVLHFKYQARFFRLLERFLSSSHLPLTLLASFLKRLGRLSLNAPPAAIIPIIPFTYNLLKRHPALMVLIHRGVDDGASSDDPFKASEEDPTQTCAFESSLWDLLSHTTHYHPVVATLARVFSEAFTKPGYNMEDFLDHTYGTLFTTEAKRAIKGAPALQIVSGNHAVVEPDSVPPVFSGMLFC